MKNTIYISGPMTGLPDMTPRQDTAATLLVCTVAALPALVGLLLIVLARIAEHG